MRRMLCVLGLAFVFPFVADAQDTPKVEIFGGYSYVRVGTADISASLNEVPLSATASPRVAIAQLTETFTFTHQNLNGWTGSVAYNVKPWFGVVADFTGVYGTPAIPSDIVPTTAVNLSMHAYSFLFGPRFSFRRSERWTPFVHTLFGRAHVGLVVGLPEITSLSIEVPESGFAMAIGGGLDAKVRKHFAIRLVQADYLMTHLLGSTQNNARIATGVVLRY